MIRLLLLDDHPAITSGLSAHFVAAPGFTVTAVTSTFREAMRVATTQPVDVTIADIHLDATLTPRQVSSLAERCKVVLFSAFSREPFAARLAEAGAATVVDKSARIAELEAIVRDVHAGRPTRAQRPAASTSSLSEREQLVFHALAKCATPKEVATSLGIARSTVYCHIDRIRQKLGVETLQEIVALAYSSAPVPPSGES